MNTDNITSKGITLNENGKLMQIEIYEKQIQELTNNWNELEELISNLLKEADSTKSDLYIYEQNKAIMRMILDKMKEIKEGNNDKNQV